MEKLKEEGIKVYPDPKAIQLIQDKGLQKQVFVDHGIATSDFKLFESPDEVRQAIENDLIQIPFVQKTRGRPVQLSAYPHPLKTSI